MAKYLLDTSAIYPLVLMLREEVLKYIDKFMVLDLTLYEVGNTIWKETKRGKIKNPAIVAKVFEELFKFMDMIRVSQELTSILSLALKENITFYDAAYIYIARKHGLKLVTSDKELLKLNNTVSVDKLLNKLKQKAKSHQGHIFKAPQHISHIEVKKNHTSKNTKPHDEIPAVKIKPYQYSHQQ